MRKEQAKVSRLLSLVLRHKPETIDAELDANGWIDCITLLDQLKKHGHSISREELNEIVEKNDKQRFKLSENGLRIRANQGHSIDVDVELVESKPPRHLYHGTAERFVESIQEKGLLKRTRQHVHLSADLKTARKVGSRHGKPCVFQVDCQTMAKEGKTFYTSENGVWLIDYVDPHFLNVLS